MSWGYGFSVFLFFVTFSLDSISRNHLTPSQWLVEEAQISLVEMRQNLKDPKIHAYTEWYGHDPSPTFLELVS
jgi:hypothetical protein